MTDSGNEPATVRVRGGERVHRKSESNALRSSNVEARGCFAYEGRFPTHCPLCFGALALVPDRPGYTRHAHVRRASHCVLTTDQYQPPDLTARVRRHPNVSEAARRRFVDDWERHYALLRHLWPAFTVVRLITVLAYADVLDIWSYAKLREQDVAPLLLALAGFMRCPEPSEPVRLPGEKIRWVRFWFDASVRDVGDLWASRADAPGFFRIEYGEPVATPFPTGSEMLRWTMLHDLPAMWAGFREKRAFATTPAERVAFERFIARANRI